MALEKHQHHFNEILSESADPEQAAALDRLRLSSWSAVEQITDRQICANCGRKRMYFCYDCRAYIPEVASLAPTVELPYKVDIIKHWLERNSKSTALHCKLLAPSSTRVFDSFEDVPNYSADASNTVIVFPFPDAVSIDEYVARNGPIKRFVVLDATWFGVKRLCRLPQLRSLPKIALKTYKTKYWRQQKGFSDEFLATIEAIYYAICENEDASKKWHIDKITPASNAVKGDVNAVDKIDAPEDSRCFDDLLFWFYFFRGMVDPEKRKNNR